MKNNQFIVISNNYINKISFKKTYPIWDLFFPAIGNHKWENKPQIQNKQIKLTGKLNSLRKKMFCLRKS